MTTIHDAERWRRIDMRVDNGAVCASIYLPGAERTAEPDGHSMLHETTLAASKAPEGDRASVPMRGK